MAGALLNYSTKVPVEQTLAEIQRTLGKHGAREVVQVFGADGEPVAMRFTITTPFGLREFELPCNVDGVQRAMQRDQAAGLHKNSQGKPTPAQARRVAWRIVKDWIEAQAAIIRAGAVTIDQVMLPYMLVAPDKTLHAAMVERQLALPPAPGR